MGFYFYGCSLTDISTPQEYEPLQRQMTLHSFFSLPFPHHLPCAISKDLCSDLDEGPYLSEN